MINNNYNTNTSWYDLLFNMLLGFIVMFVIVLAMVASKLQTMEKTPEIKGEFLITMTWQQESDDDVDLWVENPAGQIISFVNKTAGFMTLERDDYGHRNDSDSNGVLIYNENREIVIIRKVMPGEYIVNAHLYHKSSGEPARITMTLEKITPYSQAASKSFELSNRGEEFTAFRFFVDKDGNVTDVNDNPKLFVGQPSEER